MLFFDVNKKKTNYDNTLTKINHKAITNYFMLCKAQSFFFQFLIVFIISSFTNVGVVQQKIYMENSIDKFKVFFEQFRD